MQLNPKDWKHLKEESGKINQTYYFQQTSELSNGSQTFSSHFCNLEGVMPKCWYFAEFSAAFSTCENCCCHCWSQYDKLLSSFDEKMISTAIDDSTTSANSIARYLHERKIIDQKIDYSYLVNNESRKFCKKAPIHFYRLLR